MSKEQIKSAEIYAANVNEKQSIRDWYKDHTAIEVHDDGMNTLLKLFDTEEFGENGECEDLQNVIREMFYRLSELQTTNTQLLEKVDKLESENRELREALEPLAGAVRNLDTKSILRTTVVERLVKYVQAAEQALKQKNT